MESNAIQSRADLPIVPEQTQTQTRTRIQQDEQNQQENTTPPPSQQDSSNLSTTGVALSRTSVNPSENNTPEIDSPEQARDRTEQIAQTIETNPALANTAQSNLTSEAVESLLS